MGYDILERGYRYIFFSKGSVNTNKIINKIKSEIKLFNISLDAYGDHVRVIFHLPFLSVSYKMIVMQSLECTGVCQ